jgi:4-amino-4-deoxy-L-arabinose transferase-like glycosyltransferase
MNIWDMRHLLSAMFGLAGLAAVFQWAKLVSGEKTGIVAVAVLALTGAWIGGMFTHTKDVPFAACMAWAAYYTTRVLQRLPAPPLRLVLKLGAAIGMAFGLRVGAVFAVFYVLVGIATTALFLAGPSWSDKGRFALRSVWNLWPAAWVAFGLMAVFWPWVVMSPGNLLEAATTFSHFSFNLYTIVDGVQMKNGEVPASYLLQYLQVRMPELALLGIAAGLVFLPKAILRIHPGLMKDRRRVLLMLPLALSILVPLTFTLATTPALYNGVRHFLFVLPPLAILAAIGLRSLWYWAIRMQYGALTTLALCGGLAAFNLTSLVHLHPYEYVAYNELFAGGLVGAKDKWELDYWSDGVRESANQLTAFVKAEGKVLREPYTVAVCAESMQADEWLGPQFTLTSNWLKADFYISTTHMGCDKVMKGDVIGTVEREGIKLSVLKDRRNLLPIDRIPH